MLFHVREEKIRKDDSRWGRWHQEHPQQRPTGTSIAVKLQDRVKTSCDGGKDVVLLPLG